MNITTDVKSLGTGSGAILGLNTSNIANEFSSVPHWILISILGNYYYKFNNGEHVDTGVQLQVNDVARVSVIDAGTTYSIQFGYKEVEFGQYYARLV